MPRLTPDQLETLTECLADTLDLNDLQRFIYVSTGDQLYRNFVNRMNDDPLVDVVRKVLGRLEQRGETLLFLAEVYRRRKKNSEVRGVILQVCPEAERQAALRDSSSDISLQRAGKSNPDQPPSAGAPGFESNIRPQLPEIDVLVWRERLGRLERQVCRIERDGRALGTGFLVSPRAVLTNWHVVERAATAGSLAQIACRFDYRREADGSRHEGVTAALDAASPLIDHSPYGAREEKNIHEPPPAPDELDYALLRLRDPIGDVDGRGWLTVTPAPLPPVDAPLLILQHPDGKPIKLALDTHAVLGVNSNKTRLRYATNTECGSSGSPCFSLAWDLLALHHFGDPTWETGKPTFNQGVPIGLIRSQLLARGHAALLGT